MHANWEQGQEMEKLDSAWETGQPADLVGGIARGCVQRGEGINLKHNLLRDAERPGRSETKRATKSGPCVTK